MGQARKPRDRDYWLGLFDATTGSHLRGERHMPYDVTDPTQHFAEEAESLHLCLDDQQVPRAEGNVRYSLWGRVIAYADRSRDRGWWFGFAVGVVCSTVPGCLVYWIAR